MIIEELVLKKKILFIKDLLMKRNQKLNNL